jgi:superfamily II DNA or RNA helicase
VGKAFRRVKKDIFDLILIDEGHHAPARTWRILIESFPNARKVLFTATPFRRDKLEIPGSLVYSYSLAKALKDGVYCPIEFVGVSLPDPKHKHQLLIEEAKRVVKNERKAGRDSKLVIRTDHIRSAERLERLYKRNSLTIGLVHSNRSLGHNREVIRQLRAGDLDGIICIGMLGEGFDLPELKIAVYHELECSPMVRVGLHQASAGCNPKTLSILASTSTSNNVAVVRTLAERFRSACEAEGCCSASASRR